MISKKSNLVAASNLKFSCPKDGKLKKQDVDVMCNRCDRRELTFEDGMYLCPACLLKKDGNFRCRICGSKKVKMTKS
ncbi:hypothetical protein ACFLZ1_00185 [Patescibacteria group bacterium]